MPTRRGLYYEGNSSVSFEAVRFCGLKTKYFNKDSEILDTAQIVFDLRGHIRNPKNQEVYKDLTALESAVVKKFHKIINQSNRKLHVIETFRRYRLNRLEKEILLYMALSILGMLGHRVGPAGYVDISDVQNAVNRKKGRGIPVLQALTEDSRLISAGLISVENNDIAAENMLQLADKFLAPLLHKEGPLGNSWGVSKYEKLLDKLYPIVLCLQERSENLVMERFPHWSRYRNQSQAAYRRLQRFLMTLSKTLHQHPDWPLSKFFDNGLNDQEQLMIVALIGKELGYLHSSSDLFTGLGLASAVSRDVPNMRHNLELLKSKKPLRSKEYIRICGGMDNYLALDDETTLRSCEFELTPDLSEKLKIKRNRKSSASARKPLMKMEQLVLHDNVVKALKLAEAQYKHAEILLGDWGLGKTITYGQALTLLFWGPPGVGKTAAAEALAHELKKKIIVANYSEIQNCWVGQTEKNIVKTFREAREADAVLFWDEADAMFYDRDNAYRNWEVRDVNILLQELEKFSGLCILSTNREITLDKALERRIAIKVHFHRPDREMALHIWKKIVPKKLPLDRDINFKELAGADLTGGEIKNVLLNAARFALCRGPKSKVTMSDMKEAMALEKGGMWTSITDKIGFHRR